MVLLKELLNSADPFFIGDDTKPTLAIPEVNYEQGLEMGRSGNSTIPSFEGSGLMSRPLSSAVVNKKRRASQTSWLKKMLKRQSHAAVVTFVFQ